MRISGGRLDFTWNPRAGKRRAVENTNFSSSLMSEDSIRENIAAGQALTGKISGEAGYK